MLCQRCNQRNASIHITKIVNGEKQELHLCDQCGKYQDKFDMNFSFSNFISSMLDFEEDNNHLGHFFHSTTQCQNCGMDYQTFKRYGKFGCDKCYLSFRNYVSPIIKKLHGKDQHIGKVVKTAGESIRIDQEISELNTKLKAAVEREEYEKAAEYRDKIKRLKEELHKKS